MIQPSDDKNMQFISENMEDAVCITNKFGYLVHANTAAMTLLGITSAQIPEKRIWELFPLVEENDNLIQLFIDAMTSGQNTRQQLVNYVNADGQLFQLRVCLRYSAEDGLFLVIMNDLTELIKVMSAFARYTSPQIAAYVLGTPGGEKQGGDSRVVSILMSDLRGFTSMGASMAPNELVTIVNHYFETMVDVIEHHGGTVIEFLGDGIFAVFGAPNQNADHARQAVECAIEMQNAMADVNKWNRENGFPPMEMGIGINSGEAVVGNIGSPKKMKYGCMGDSVNLAGRTESFTVGGQVFITQDTLDMVGASLVETASKHSFLPKGHAEPVNIYEVLGVGDVHLDTGHQGTSWLRTNGQDVEVTFSEVTGKIVDEAVFTGTVRGVSEDYRYALFNTDKPLDLLENIMLEIGGKLAAKVMAVRDDDYVICFTAKPSSFDEWILQFNSK